MSRKPSRSPDVEGANAEAGGRDAASMVHRILIVVFVVAANANSFGGAFIFDDNDRILDEPAVRQVLPLSDHLATRRPLVSLSLAINHAVDGFNVRGYHVFNLLVHVLAALTLYALVRRTLIQSPRLKWEANAAGGFAFAVALLWALHPLQTQSVTYIIQRGESMAGLFYLLTFYCVLRASASGGSARWGVLAIAVCAAGMASKAVVVTAPVLAVIFDRVLLAENWRRLRRRWWLHLGLACTWLVLVVCGVARGLFVSGEPGGRATVGFGTGSVSPWEYAVTQPGVILHYLRLVFWPNPLVLDYDWPVETNTALIVLQVGVLAGLLIAAVWCLKKRPAIGFAGLAFFVVLSPTSSIVPIRDLAFEHRMYLPLACVLIVVLAIVRLGLIRIRKGTESSESAARGVAGFLVLFAAICCAMVTFDRNRAYDDPQEMWQSIVKLRPLNSRAHANVGWCLLQKGDLAGAEAATREAIRLREDYADGYVSLGQILKYQGKSEEAVRAFEGALEHGSDSAAARTNLIPILLAGGQVDEAVEHGRRAVALRPNMVEAHVNYAMALMQKGDIEAALSESRTAIRLNPDAYQAHFNLGRMQLDAGRFAEAEAAFRAVTRIAPTLAQGHYLLGIALANQGRVQDAVAAFQAALRIDPNHAEARRQIELAPR